MTKDAQGRTSRFSSVVALVGAVVFGAAGVWALAAPRSFFDALADFEPYNQHFVQDIGAFQIGLGAVLLLAAAVPAIDALTVALLGTGAGGAAHVISHLIGLDLGGTPALDVPSLSLLAGLLLAAGIVRRQSTRG